MAAMRRETKVRRATVPGVGDIICLVTSQIQANGQRVNPSMKDARYARTRMPVENEHLDTVRRFLGVD